MSESTSIQAIVSYRHMHFVIYLQYEYAQLPWIYFVKCHTFSLFGGSLHSHFASHFTIFLHPKECIAIL